MGRKIPFVEVKERNPFGESVNPEAVKDPEFTSNYIPGYSEKMRDRQLDIAAGPTPDTVEHRFHWARIRKLTDNSEEGRRVQHWKQKGYRKANYEEMKKLGYDLDKNDAISKGADGNAYWGEHVLMVTDAETAAAIWEQNQLAMENQANEYEAKVAQAVENFNMTDVAKKTRMTANPFEMEAEVQGPKKKKR